MEEQDSTEEVQWQALEIYTSWLDNMNAHSSNDWEYSIDIDAQSKELMIQEVFALIGVNEFSKEIEKAANKIFDHVYFDDGLEL